MARTKNAEHARKAIGKDWVIKSSSSHDIECSTKELMKNPKKCISFTAIYIAYAISRGGIKISANSILGIMLRFFPRNIYLIRALNREEPSRLVHKSALKRIRNTARIATIVTGELRCIRQNKEIINTIGKNTDLFIITTNEYHEAAKTIRSKRLIDISKCKKHELLEREARHPAIKQWIKYNKAWELIREVEEKEGINYDYVIKIRSDYYFSDIYKLISQQNYSQLPPNTLYGSSDKVFGGRRETMVKLEGLMNEAKVYYGNWGLINKDIDIEQIIKSDESIKWYGLNFRRDIIGNDRNPIQIKRKLKMIHKKGINKLGSEYFDNKEKAVFEGDKVFPAEIIFAKILNVKRIPMKTAEGYIGVLLKNRKQGF